MDSETRVMLSAIIEGQQVTNARLEAVDLRLARLEGHAAASDKRFDEMDRRFDGIEDRLSRLEGDLSQVKAQSAEMLTSIHFLVDKVGQHDHQIYLLRNRTPAQG